MHFSSCRLYFQIQRWIRVMFDNVMGNHDVFPLTFKVAQGTSKIRGHTALKLFMIVQRTLVFVTFSAGRAHVGVRVS